MNAGIRKLLSNRYVIGFPEQRLAYLATKIAEQSADYCVVLRPRSQHYLGMFRIADVANTAGAENRILADLLDQPRFVDVLPNTDIRAIENLLMKEDTGAVPLVDHEGEFVGLITSDSYAEHALREERRRLRQLGRIEQGHPSQPIPFEADVARKNDRKDS